MNVNNLKHKTIAAFVSGGLDSCTIVRWLADNEVNVICFTADLGQPDESSMNEVRKRLLASGAREAIIVDARGMMAKAGCLAVQAQAVYEGEYWNTTGIGRHVIVAALLPEVKKRGINIFLHGATGRGNDQVRFQLVANMLDPAIQIYAPWRDEIFLRKFGGRKEMIDFCKKRKLPIKHSHQKPYSTDANLLGLTHEAGKLEFLNTPALFIESEMGNLATDAPDKKEEFEVTFKKGWPVKINGLPTTNYQAFDRANKIGGKHGIGIAHHLVENRFVGIKSRGVYEQPGIVLLGQCYEYILELILDRRARRLFNSLSKYIGEQIYQGYWFDTGSQAAMAGIKHFADLATGIITVELYKGQIFFKEAKNTPHSIYSVEDASMENVGSFDHTDSEGLLRILGVSAKSLATHRQIDISMIEDK